MSIMRQFIEEFIRRHYLSLEKLAAQLNYKSKTSIERLMDDKVREKSVLYFEESMNRAFALTPEEVSNLHRAVRITLHGKQNYLAECEMWDFIQGNSPSNYCDDQDCERDVQIIDAADLQAHSLLDRYRGMSSIHIVLVNSPYVNLFSSLEKLIVQENATVDHYLSVNADNARTIYTINVLMPIFYLKRYNGYMCMATDDSALPLPKGMMDADIMICSFTDKQGNPHEDLIVFQDVNTGRMLSLPGGGDIFSSLLKMNREMYVPIKRTYFECSSTEDYIQYSSDYAALEYNRAVYKIKPDIGVDWIDTQYMANALREGPFPKEEHFEQILEALSSIYDRRFQNTFSKKKAAYSVLKKGAMRQFMLTGKSSDHFWGMRPYTWEERIEILSTLLKQSRQNPYFHLFFLKQDDLIRDVEMTYYEGLGILMLRSDTDYNLEQGHSEVMLNHPEMMRLFQRFLLVEIIGKHTLSEEESCAFLESLIEECYYRASKH